MARRNEEGGRRLNSSGARRTTLAKAPLEDQTKAAALLPRTAHLATKYSLDFWPTVTGDTRKFLKTQFLVLVRIVLFKHFLMWGEVDWDEAPAELGETHVKDSSSGCASGGGRGA